MRKLYVIENVDDFKSLMITLEEEGARWLNGSKPTKVRYTRYFEVVHVTNNIITAWPLKASLEITG